MYARLCACHVECNVICVIYLSIGFNEMYVMRVMYATIVYNEYGNAM